jgi:hypothetical protein
MFKMADRLYDLLQVVGWVHGNIARSVGEQHHAPPRRGQQHTDLKKAKNFKFKF